MPSKLKVNFLADESWMRKDYRAAVRRSLQRLGAGEIVDSRRLQAGMNKVVSLLKENNLDPGQPADVRRAFAMTLADIFERHKGGRPRRTLQEQKNLLLKYLELFISGKHLTPLEARKALRTQNSGWSKTDGALRKALIDAAEQLGFERVVVRRRADAEMAVNSLKGKLQLNWHAFLDDVPIRPTRAAARETQRLLDLTVLMAVASTASLGPSRQNRKILVPV